MSAECGVKSPQLSDEDGPQESLHDSEADEEIPILSNSKKHIFPAMSELSVPCGKLYQQQVPESVLSLEAFCCRWAFLPLSRPVTPQAYLKTVAQFVVSW